MLKKVIAWLHLWLGLASGIIVLILSITGCVLVFEQEIKILSETKLKPARLAALLPPSQIHNAVSRAFPNREVHSIWYYGLEKPAVVSIDSDSAVHINPTTAEIISFKSTDDIFHFMEDGHRYLWLGKTIGRPIVGWATFIFFLLLISGLVLWWPKKWNKRGRSQSFNIRWNARFKRLNYDLHNVLGFYAILVSLVFAFTGLMISFIWFNSSVYTLTGGTVRPFVKPMSDSTYAPQSPMLVQADKAWRKGIYEIGDYDPTSIIIMFPEKASEAFYLCVDMHKGRWRDVFLDQHTLEILPASQSKLKDEAISSWLRRSNYSLHVGSIGGLPLKIVYFMASLICASLPVTGFYIWWLRRKNR